MTSKKKKQSQTDWLVKSYENPDFLHSPPARILRVLSEMIEPAHRFHKHKMWNTVVFFGSARTLSGRTARKNLKEIESRVKRSKQVSSKLKSEFKKAKRDVIMSQYYDDAVKLAEKLTLWFKEIESEYRRFTICTGGGPGIMEAANRGAKKAKGESVGLNISLPFEQDPNPYQTRELSFEFHYFFIRKFWFFYLAKALVVFPGGYGTLDEFFDLLTIIQTEKTKKFMPVILYGSEYWNKVINIEEMFKWGTISESDLKLFKVYDDIDSAFEYLKSELLKRYINRKK
ncbi:MAG: LOG family protein [candidate division Zixibacteria bacterium]|nr:LOG family protein [candidate division Zixibacteria bacterium]